MALPLPGSLAFLCRERNRHSCPDAFFAVNIQRAVVLGDDLICDGQPDARAAPRVIGLIKLCLDLLLRVGLCLRRETRQPVLVSSPPQPPRWD